MNRFSCYEISFINSIMSMGISFQNSKQIILLLQKLDPQYKKWCEKTWSNANEWLFSFIHPLKKTYERVENLFKTSRNTLNQNKANNPSKKD